MDRTENKLRKKLRSYRSARFGCLFLTVISAAVLVMHVVVGETDNAMMIPAYTSTFVWPALAYICHLKIKLIWVEIAADPNESG